MDDGGHCENGRHKPDQYKTAPGQWLVQTQPSMKQIMAIMAERDAAIHEKNMAIQEKKAAIAERDMAFLQRDSAIAERNNALMERDNVIATLQYCENPLGNGNLPSCPPGCQISRSVKHVHHPHQQIHHLQHINMATNETVPISPVSSEASKPRRGKRPKDPQAKPPNKKTTKSPQIKRENEDQELVVPKSDWKSQDLGLNQIAFDETTMPAPVCSCTGTYRQCYKWGNGGWQSSCCTTTLSMHPLPAVPNKRHARIGGRKMSGSAFSKLLSRLAAEGYDLSNPVDLKEHWAKHGTNRYITIK